MRLDHVSYVASHDQISDVVNRIGSQIETAFIDGGIHPKFGTRNFTAPLLNGQYIEVVCPMEHPATDATPFGKAVKNKAEQGGGWLTWVISTDDLLSIEKSIGREAVIGQRRKPDGAELTWKQIGVLNLLDDAQMPFFIQWLSGSHPSKDGNPKALLSKVNLNGNKAEIESLIGSDLSSTFSELNVSRDLTEKNINLGLYSIELNINDKTIIID
jgi:hypothetical protein